MGSKEKSGTKRKSAEEGKAWDRQYWDVTKGKAEGKEWDRE